MRKIVHIDMDAFYAAIEQRDDPSLRGRPIAVGGASERGVVMTASYEARPYGVRSAMPGAWARRLCPDLLFVPPRFAVYKAVSQELRTIFLRHTPLVEPLSLDEAYLDVTEPLAGPMPAVAIARAIKAEIHATTGLTASAGVSFNKFLAKIASDLRKPDGLAVILPERAHEFIARLPIERFHGVGPATARRMKALGIATGADLQAMSEAALVNAFGSAGRHYHRVAQASDDRPVQPARQRRSLSVEETFARDLLEPTALLEELQKLAHELDLRLRRSGFLGRSLTLKIKLADFRILTRRVTRSRPFVERGEIAAQARSLLLRAPPPGRVRLLGLGVGTEHRAEDARQFDLELDEAPELEA